MQWKIVDKKLKPPSDMIFFVELNVDNKKVVTFLDNFFHFHSILFALEGLEFRAGLIENF